MTASTLQDAAVDVEGAMPTALRGHECQADDMPTQGSGHGTLKSAACETFNFRWLLLLAAAMLVVLAGPALIGRVYTADDLGAFHLPMRAFYADCLHRGVAFDWSPQLYGGFYLTGEGQIGGYHPLHWLLYRWLPLPVAFDLECLIGYPVMLAGMYFFLRRWALRRDAAMFGAICFAFSGFCLLHFVHVNAIEVVAHLPWLLWAIHGMFNDSGRSRTFASATFALLTASQWLMGYPQYVFYSAIAEVGYAALMIRDGRAAKPQAALAVRNWLRLGFWATLGTLIGAVQLLPTLEALQESTRQTAGGDFTNWGSLAPLNLVQLIAPYLFKTRVVGQNTHELGLYIGAAPLLLAAACVVANKPTLKERRLRIFAAMLALIGLLIAFGEFGPLGCVMPYIPLLRSFRFPCRAIVLVHFGVAALAAIGFQKLATSKARAIWILAWIPALAVGVALVAPLEWPDYVATLNVRWFGPFVLVVAAGLIFLATRGRRWAVAAVCLLAIADLGAYGLVDAVRLLARGDDLLAVVDITEGYGVNCTLSPHDKPLYVSNDWRPERIALDLAQPNQPGLRVGNEDLLAGAYRIDGYAGLEPARRLDYRKVPALQAANVRWVCDSAPVGHAELTSDKSGWMVPMPMPYLRTVAKTVVSNDPARDICHISIESTALVDKPVGALLGPPGVARIADNDGRLSNPPGDIHVDLSVPGRQLLVLAESFHPGWHAVADGSPIPIVRTNGDFMGCVVEPAMKVVNFHFAPASLFYGQLATFLGLGLLVGATILSTVRPRPAYQDSSPGTADPG